MLLTLIRNYFCVSLTQVMFPGFVCVGETRIALHVEMLHFKLTNGWGFLVVILRECVLVSLYYPFVLPVLIEYLG